MGVSESDQKMEKPLMGIPMPGPLTPPGTYQDLRLAPGGDATLPWSTGLCDCFSDFGQFCITFWCPCYTFGQVSEIVDRGSSSCGTNGALYFLLAWVTGCASCYSLVYRMKMRKLLSLEGSGCQDCLYHCFCEACALTQEYRELQSRGFDVSLGWLGNVERQNHRFAMAPVVEPSMKR